MKRIVAVACLVAGTLFADTTPVMVSLVTPVQAPSRSYDVTGLRLSFIYGECQDFTGLDKCIWCGSTSNGSGCPYSPTRRHEK